ncbi:MAG: tetratricopeptide repeat protein, partial [Gemmatimonadales bacterium]
MRLALLAVTVAGAGLPRLLSAQAPIESAALTAWFDSVDAAPVAKLPELDGASRTGTGALGEIRRDLYRARVAQTSHDRHALVNTLIALDILADAHSHWAWPPFVLANAYADLARAHVPLLNLSDQRLGESHVDALWRYLRDALHNDPELAPARALAINIMVAGGDRELTSDEHAILATVLLRPDPEADALLVLARDLRRRQKYDSALSVFDASLAAGGDVSRLALERARTLRALGRPGAAEQAYWEGLQRMTPVGREMYHFDLAWILAPDSLAAFERLPDDAVLGWMHRFWDERDAAAANHSGERLLEQLRRWVVAYANFRVDRPWRYTQMTRVEYLFEGFIGPGKGWDRCIASDAGLYDLLSHEAPVHPGDIRDREPLLDHRGLIYLKHGQPWRTLTPEVALMAHKDAEALTPSSGLE